MTQTVPRISIGVIPDFSTPPLYAAAVLATRDDPRLLALWCHYAFWQPVDAALRQPVDVATWAERTGLSPQELAALSATLVRRGLLSAAGHIPHWALLQASLDAVLPYSDELRRRAGLPTLGPVQGALFPEAARPAAPSCPAPTRRGRRRP
jgi:hypothetical protein